MAMKALTLAWLEGSMVARQIVVSSSVSARLVKKAGIGSATTEARVCSSLSRALQSRRMVRLSIPGGAAGGADTGSGVGAPWR